MLSSTPGEAKILRRERYGTDIKFLQHFGEAYSADIPGPQGFLVCLPPGGGARAHAHDVDQFQVFFGGKGCTLGRHEVPPVLMHYTDAYTPYGPFAAGPDGMDFFTLRARATVQTMFIPEDRNKLVRKPRRTYHVEIRPGDALRMESRLDTLIAPQPDGLAAYHLTVGAAGNAVTPPLLNSGGQYCILVGGELTCEGRRFPTKSCFFVTPRDGNLRLDADQDSAFDIIILQFPAATAAQ